MISRRQFVHRARAACLSVAWLVLVPYTPMRAAASDAIQLRSSSLLFSIRPESLSAIEWQNQLSGASLKLGGGSELEIEVGDKPEQARQLQIQLAGAPVVSGREDQATLPIRSEDGSLAGSICYRLDPEHGVVQKFVELTNVSPAPLRILNVVLGRYSVRARAEDQDRRPAT
jgi:hypothetical protein